MYLERKKKLAVMKTLIEKSLLRQGSYPNKAYVQKLLNDLDMRLAILDYIHVSPEKAFDTEKMNQDLFCIQKDLEVLYDIVNTLAEEKYLKLESYVNGYLSNLEGFADKADKKAMAEVEATTLDATIDYFTDQLPSAQFNNDKVTLYLGSVSCSPQSRVYTTIEGTGFTPQNVVFNFGADKLTPYSVHGDTLKMKGTLTKNTYAYNIPESQGNSYTFKIANDSITANEHNTYEIFGGKDMITYRSNSSNKLVSCKDVLNTLNLENNLYVSFYLTNATQIQFDFSAEPTYKNFSSDVIQNMKRDAIRHFEFKLPYNSSFSWTTDGTIYATQEKFGINNNELYITERTLAKDFIIYEYKPGDKIVYGNVTVEIYNVSHQAFFIDSISIKEISDLEVKEEDS